jgi:hypothetical protein
MSSAHNHNLGSIPHSTYNINNTHRPTYFSTIYNCVFNAADQLSVRLLYLFIIGDDESLFIDHSVLIFCPWRIGNIGKCKPCSEEMPICGLLMEVVIGGFATSDLQTASSRMCTSGNIPSPASLKSVPPQIPILRRLLFLST